MVGVVQQDHVARTEVARRASGDALRRRELAPVLAPARPQQRLEAELARSAQPGARVDAERRAMEARPAADDLQCALDVGPYGRPALAGLHPMAVAVDADLVTASSDLGRNVRVALDLLADEEEDGPRVRGVE
jgi:hypothetical protein